MPKINESKLSSFISFVKENKSTIVTVALGALSLLVGALGVAHVGKLSELHNWNLLLLGTGCSLLATAALNASGKHSTKVAVAIVILAIISATMGGGNLNVHDFAVPTLIAGGGVVFGAFAWVVCRGYVPQEKRETTGATGPAGQTRPLCIDDVLENRDDGSCLVKCTRYLKTVGEKKYYILIPQHETPDPEWNLIPVKEERHGPIQLEIGSISLDNLEEEEAPTPCSKIYASKWNDPGIPLFWTQDPRIVPSNFRSITCLPQGYGDLS